MTRAPRTIKSRSTPKRPTTKQRPKKHPQAKKSATVGLAAVGRQKVIDIHSHVFNTDYLPWVGVIKRFLGGREKLGFVVDTLAAHLPPRARIEELANSDPQALADRIKVDHVEGRIGVRAYYRQSPLVSYAKQRGHYPAFYRCSSRIRKRSRSNWSSCFPPPVSIVA